MIFIHKLYVFATQATVIKKLQHPSKKAVHALSHHPSEAQLLTASENKVYFWKPKTSWRANRDCSAIFFRWISTIMWVLWHLRFIFWTSVICEFGPSATWEIERHIVAWSRETPSTTLNYPLMLSLMFYVKLNLFWSILSSFIAASMTY